MSSGGGSGNSGTTRYEWNDAMAPYWGGLLQNASGQAQQPYQQYQGSRIADMTQDQYAGQAAIRNYVSDPSGFLYGRGVDQFANTLSGDYLNGPDANPYASQSNPWEGASATVPSNEYMGDNPYFQKQMQTGMEDITNAYKNGTAADTDRMFTLAGAFGGSANQNAVSNNQNALAKQLGTYANTMQSGQYDRSANLREADIGRQLQNQQLDKQLGGQWTAQDLDRGSQTYENERQRQMQAGTASQADQGLTFDRYNALMGVGAQNQQQQQAHDDLGYQNFFDQQNYGKNQAAWLASILSAAQGGLPPSQMTSSKLGGSAVAGNAIGGALGAYGLFRS